MQDNRINYVVVGAFVAAVLVAFVVVISVLAGSTGSVDKYYATYGNVGGIKLGTLVLYEGFQIGEVSKVEPMHQGRDLSFKVSMEIQRNAQIQIPSDSIARPEVAGLLSAVVIDIRGGKSDVMLKPGSQIKSQEAGNLFATLADVGSEFSDLSTNSIRPLLNNLNTFVGQLNVATAGRLPEIMDNLDKLSASVQHSAAAIDNGVFKPENMDHIDRIIASADQTAANLAQLSHGLEDTRKLLNQSAEKIDKLVDTNSGNVDEAMRNFRYTLDTISRYVDDIAHNADDTARNMAEFSRSIRDNPGLLLRGGGTPPDRQGDKDGHK